nr:hypothetical protein [Novosphingobium sp. ST904]
MTLVGHSGADFHFPREYRPLFRRLPVPRQQLVDPVYGMAVSPSANEKFDRNDQFQRITGPVFRRPGQWLGTFRQCRRFAIEFRETAGAFEAGRQHTPVPVHRETDIGNALLTAGMGSRGIAPILVEPGKDPSLPAICGIA